MACKDFRVKVKRLLGSRIFSKIKLTFSLKICFDTKIFLMLKFRNFQNFVISNILFDDVFTDWLSKRTVYFFLL